MNKTKIEWTDYSVNPLGLGCLWLCWYCYAKRQARRLYFMKLSLYKRGKIKTPPCELCRDFKPHFHPERLEEFSKIKKPSKIFVCSCADIFASWTKPEWRESILNEMAKYPQHNYQLLTKQPQEIPKGRDFGKNVWIGATVTKQDEIDKIDEIKKVKCGVKFISFEPLLEETFCNLSGIDWIIIGKLTGSKKIPLQKEWVEHLLLQARKYKIPVFIKNNLKYMYSNNLIQEYPNDNYG